MNIIKLRQAGFSTLSAPDNTVLIYLFNRSVTIAEIRAIIGDNARLTQVDGGVLLHV